MKNIVIFYSFFIQQIPKKKILKKILSKSSLKNFEIICDEKLKNHILRKSVFAVTKSGTVSLEISNNKIPSIIIYKMNPINFIILKMLVKIKFANIINIAANEMIIPELLQSKCNPKKIFETVSNFLENHNKIDLQIRKTDEVLKTFKTKEQPSEVAANALIKFLSF